MWENGGLRTESGRQAAPHCLTRKHLDSSYSELGSNPQTLASLLEMMDRSREVLEKRQAGMQSDTRENEKLPSVPDAGELKSAAFCLKRSWPALGV